MEDGVYAVSFIGNGRVMGTGTVMVRDGAIHGGDGAYAYLGKVNVSGDKATASLQVVQHQKGRPSVFGSQSDFELKLSGPAPKGATFELKGTASVAGGGTIAIQARKIKDLIA